MRRFLRRLGLAVLAVGAVAGALAAWRIEAAVPAPRVAVEAQRHLITPVLSVRRVPEVLAAPIAGRRLRTDLGALTGLLPPDSCLAVAGPELRFEHRPAEPRVPASTQKLLTATAALEALDPEVRFRTTVMSSSAPAAGVVAGDLILVGGGDPVLATADYAGRFQRQPQIFTDLDTLAAAVQRAGVTRVDGAVVGDESRYDTVRYVAGWPQRYIDQDAIGPLSALAVNDGFARYPTEDDRDIPLEPAPQPAVEAAAVFTRLLEARGIEVVGQPAAGSAPDTGEELAAIESPPVLDVLGQLLLESDNSTAELLFKEMGRSAGAPTTASGAAVVQDVVAGLGDALVVDGSGLSLDDRVTCGLLVDVLLRPETGDVVDDLLPVAGQTGTLTERFVGTPLEGVLRAKTGSLTSVMSLAGVVEDDDPPLVFALVVNVPPPAAVPDGVELLQQRIGETLVAWPRGPDLDDLGPRPAGR